MYFGFDLSKTITTKNFLFYQVPHVQQRNKNSLQALNSSIIYYESQIKIPEMCLCCCLLFQSLNLPHNQHCLRPQSE